MTKGAHIEPQRIHTVVIYITIYTSEQHVRTNSVVQTNRHHKDSNVAAPQTHNNDPRELGVGSKYVFILELHYNYKNQ